MTVLFAMKAIKPKRALSVAAVRARILNAGKEEGRAMKQTLEGDVTGTWSHKPVFSQPIIRYRGGDLLIVVTTDDDIFGYLNRGTGVRYAALSRDWRSKTAPRGGLRSGPGAGSVIARGKKAGPQRGIEARDFTGRVAAKHGPLLGPKIRDAISKGLGGP